MLRYTVLLLLSMQQLTSLSQTTLIYVGDPMCSWCYGISEELTSVWDSHASLDKEVVLGGLRAGGGDEWTSDFREFLRHHWQDVHTATGVEFNYGLLDLDHFSYDTSPACKAVVVARSIDPSSVLPFFKAVQRRFYLDNMDPLLVSTYLPICEELGIDWATFSERFEAAAYDELTIQDYTRARSLGVRSFPALLLLHEGETTVIASGYADAATMTAAISALLK